MISKEDIMAEYKETQNRIDVTDFYRASKLLKPFLEVLIDIRDQHTLEIAKQEGRREVVEWVKEHSILLAVNGEIVRDMQELEWQDQQRKWGL